MSTEIKDRPEEPDNTPRREAPEIPSFEEPSTPAQTYERGLIKPPKISVIGQRLALVKEERDAVCYFHTNSPITADQRAQLGELVPDIGRPVGNVVMGTLKPASLRHQVVRRYPFVVYMEKPVHLGNVL